MPAGPTPFSTSEQKLTVLRYLLVAFAAAFFFYYGLNTMNDPVFGIDFLPYHIAGQQVARGEPVSLVDQLTTGGLLADRGPFLDGFQRYFFPNSPIATRWEYMPGYAWIFAPLAGLEFPLAARLWLGVNMLLSAGMIALLWSSFKADPTHLSGRFELSWLIFLILTFQPILDNLWHGNISVLTFFFFCLGYGLLRKGKKFLAGAAIGLIVFIKFYPGIFLLYFIWRKQWKVCAGILAGMAVIAIASLLTVGPAGILEYFQFILVELNSGADPAFNNQSIAGFLVHILTNGDVNGWQEIPMPAWISILRYGVIAGLLVASIWATKKKVARDVVWAQDLDLALVIFFMLLASPITWYHYYTWLVFPLVVLIAYLTRTGRQSEMLALAIGYGLVVVQGIVVIRPFAAEALQNMWILRLLLSQSLIGCLVLAGLAIKVRRKLE